MAGGTPKLSFFDEKGSVAAAAVADWIASSLPNSVPVNVCELAQRGGSQPRAGWRIQLTDAAVGILVLDRDFPYKIPRIILLDEEARDYPHVEADRRLCLDGDEARANTSAPIEVVQHVIAQARALVQSNENRQNLDDYQADFNPYWRRSAADEPAVLTLLSRAPRSREVRAYRGDGVTLLAEDDDTASHWLNNQFGDKRRNTSAALAVWLNPLPSPAQYPNTANELRRLAPEVQGDLDRLLADGRTRLFVALRGPSTAERVAGGVIRLEVNKVHGWTGARKRGGFRKGRVPAPEVNACRWGATRLKDSPVDAAISRIPPSIKGLSQRQVTIIGCGAVGSGVARMLIQSGVGRLRLIDPEPLGYENIGRHELGSADVGCNKAVALAKQLRARYPLVSKVWAHDAEWLHVLHENGDSVFDQDDLLISTTGDWNSESALSDFHRDRKIAAPALYGWLEQNAGAAHALAIPSDGTVCFRCGFDPLGTLITPVTRWATPPLVEGCASPTSPFGAVELSQSQALISDLAISLLTGAARPGVRWVWCGRNSSISALGGRWNRGWTAIHGDPGAGAVTVSAPWPTSELCPHG